MIGVAATDSNDNLGANSNTGSARVAAPGQSIYTTLPNSGYGSVTGTSAASAHVAGLAALLTASGKNNTAAYNQIIGAVDPIAGQSFGRINVAKALGVTIAPPATPTVAPTPTPGATPTYIAAVSPNIVISQIYGGGGNTGATYKNDFIELYNRGATAINVTGWSVQYASTTGTSWAKTDLSGTIQPGRYYLVQEAAGAGGTVDLPTPDATGTIAMSATAGKVVLVNNTTLISSGTSCPSGATIVDKVGYGPATNCSETAPTTTNLSNTTAAFRTPSSQDTDNNSADFTVGAPNPRNGILPAVSSTNPVNGATNVAVDANIIINFNEPVTVTGTWFTISCTGSGAHTASSSGGPKSFTLDPTVNFANGESCTVTIVANQVTDGDTPPDKMAANYSFSFTTFVADVAPSVLSTDPTNGATTVAIASNIAITFTEPVNVTGAWFTLSCAVSGSHAASVTGGPTTFTLDPGTDFAAGENCTLTVLAANVNDQDTNDPPDNMTSNFVVSFATFDMCVQPFTPIYSIQGSGLAPAITGVVTTKGVVIGDYEYPGSGTTSNFLRGFFIQDLVGDGNPTTSDGIFVFNGNSNSVSLGDVVYVIGTAGDFQDQTQISSVTNITKCGTGSVAPTDVTLPFASSTFAERYEGMLVRLPQTLYVTEHFQLGRFDQVVLSSGGRLQQPTNVTTPGAPANTLQAQNDLNRIILDDDLQNQNPDPILFGRGGNPLSASNTLRGGDTATNIVGVMTYTWAGNAASGNAYRVRPINALGGSVNFAASNPRPAFAPAVGGTLKVVGMNLLNFFNTFDGLPDTVDNCTNGVGGTPTDCRGADTQAEFDRQWPKTVAAILAMDPDIIGVNEIENDGYGSASAIQSLVDKLNAATAPGTYAFIDVDARTGQSNALGTDAIKVGMIYKPARVTPIGQTAALNSVAFVNGGDSVPRSRPSLAQAFRQNSNNAVFVLNLNHLKSKGSACDAPDAGDGQGNCNAVRVNAATALMTWLAGNPTGVSDPDILLLGDYNSYAKEDPITVIKNAGFTSLIESLLGPNAYSYVFDGQWGYLDHALGSASIVSQVQGVGDYHINADEPSVLDYNTDFKTPNLQNTLYAPDQFRVSDHDPVVVGLKLNGPPTVNAGGPYSVNEGSTVSVSATGSDPDGDPITFSWDLDNNGTFETPGQSVSFSAAGLDGPSTKTIKVRVTDSGGLTADAQATVNILNVTPVVTNLTLSATTINENGPTSLSGTFTDPGTLDTHTVVIIWGDDSPNTTLNLAAGVLTFGPVSHTYLDDNPTATPSDATPIAVTVTDKDNASGNGNTNVTVNNVAPVITSVAGPTGPIALGSSATITANFTDVGSKDTHTCLFSWDDSTPDTVNVPPGTGNGSCSASHTYTAAGVYTVQVTVTDDDTGSATTKFEFVVIYDPNDGFVTGGGWINSPAGAYTPNPSLSGKATFGFVSKYQKGANVPTGQTEFQFHVANFNFHSDVYEWLVIAGAKAQYKGTGTVNGTGNYGFLLTATDGQLPGGGGVDKFRIKIWDKNSNDGVVYDNGPGSDDIDASNQQSLSGGSITIHK